MPCSSCLQARQASSSAIRAVFTGRVSEASDQAGIAVRAVGEKIVSETMRVRGLLRR